MITELFDGDLPDEVGSLTTVTSPVAGLTDLDRCEKITMNAYTAEPRVWYPDTPNGDLIVMHQGHSWTYNQGNYNLVLQQLLTAGYTVCGLVLPGGADVVTSGSTTAHDNAELSLDHYIGPIVIAINTLAGSFSNIYMTGLSGGAWSTTLAAAVDTRISRSYPIAGTLPLYMPVDLAHGNGFRDWEQNLPGLTASYTDLYLLASDSGRRQKQILHTSDECCFNETEYNLGNPYSTFISDLATELGGQYDLVWKTKTVHEWDTTIFNDEVLSEI